MWVILFEVNYSTEPNVVENRTNESIELAVIGSILNVEEILFNDEILLGNKVEVSIVEIFDEISSGVVLVIEVIYGSIVLHHFLVYGETIRIVVVDYLKEVILIFYLYYFLVKVVNYDEINNN